MIKSHKKLQNSWNQDFAYYFCLMMEGSGSEYVHLTNGSGSRRPKNILQHWLWLRLHSLFSTRNSSETHCVIIYHYKSCNIIALSQVGDGWENPLSSLSLHCVTLLQESWRGEEAGRQLVLALCENLRCGSQVLEQALNSYHTQLGYQDLEFHQCVLQRNQLRKNFLLFSEDLKGTKSWSKLKVKVFLSKDFWG